jgi:phosphopentomutase
MKKRVVVLIIDGFGIGEAPDSASFGDGEANTCQHILLENPSLSLPTLQKLGLLDAFPKNQLVEINPNKDTLSGISEMLGTVLPKLDTFPNGIPCELIQKIDSAMGTKTLGGKPASGTTILKEFGNEHLLTGYPILYTSQDSVLQLMAHEEIICPSLLYYYCSVIRELVDPLYTIGRIIARPFLGYTPETFQRTTRRKDFVLKIENNHILSAMQSCGIEIYGNKIIQEIFGKDLIQLFSGNNNEELFKNLEQTFLRVASDNDQLYIIDLEDFDMIYGHRRDPIGYGNALKRLDEFLKPFLLDLQGDDLLIITSDHGNDPTFALHTDHTREIVPLVVFSKQKVNETFGVRKGFFHISEIIKVHFEGSLL